MSVPMRKPLIEVRVNRKNFLVNQDKEKAVILYLKALNAKVSDADHEVLWMSPKVFRNEHFAGEPSYSINLRAARRKANLSQVALAKRTGIDRSNLNAYEHGTKNIGPKVALKLSKILKVDYRVLIAE